jgi:RimJ/RimL family protein N-acetyltransferase
MTTPPPANLPDIPTTLTTERLRLRALQPGDGPAYFAAIDESREALYPFIGVGEQVQTRADAERLTRLAWVRFLERRQFRYAVYAQGSDAIIGSMVLHYGDWAVPAFELGAWMRTGCMGQGYATEATGAMIRLGFTTLNLARLEIRFDHRNTTSQRVAEKLGFTREARLRAHNVALDGVLVDEVVYALLPDEWQR